MPLASVSRQVFGENGMLSRLCRGRCLQNDSCRMLLTYSIPALAYNENLAAGVIVIQFPRIF